ncbi:uncharacterized protein LOC129919124 [Episyrphus balteatus]|uniref:uncharacterized protein LOC129919124 n=1 Tax=Episyrphus balteatus TaxID=286459 RepID=UPI00248576EC|nr:uncharacterized protein LOC129919124 [Episyrphus balteatus]
MALKGNSSIVLNVEKFIKDVENRPAIWNRNYHCNKPFLEQMWEELSSIHQLPKVVLKAKWKGLRDNFRVEYKRIPRGDNGDFLIQPAEHESKWIHYYALLFLTEHMRHRLPKTEQDTMFYFNQSNPQEYEQTLVEPDLTNGLIRIPDSDEEFDEDDVEDDDMEDPPKPLANKRPEFHGTAKKRSPQQHSSFNSMSDSTSLYNEKSSSFSNSHIPSLKLKRQRLSEDSNFNGSSTMENSAVPEDDDYHYLLSLHPYMKQLNSAQKLRIRTKIQKLIFKELYKEDLEEK